MITPDVLTDYIRQVPAGCRGDGDRPYGNDGPPEGLIVSDGFHGKNLLDRHRMIYQALDVPMKDGRIHALELTARTRDEA